MAFFDMGTDTACSVGKNLLVGYENGSVSLFRVNTFEGGKVAVTNLVECKLHCQSGIL